MPALTGFFALVTLLMFAGDQYPAFEAASLKPSQSTQPGWILRVLPGGRLKGVHLTFMSVEVSEDGKVVRRAEERYEYSFL